MIDPELQKKEKPEILIVDDSPVSLQLLTDILAVDGYRVRPASSGRLALRSVAAKVPDLVLVDVVMPGMDGYEVCRQLKSGERTRRVPVIFISAHGEITKKVEGFNVGGVDFISKPFEVEEVLARVRTHLRLQALTDHLEQEVHERTQELRKANRAYKALSGSNQALVHAVDETELLEQVCRIIVEDCGYHLVWLGFAEQDRDKTVRPVAQAGYEEGYLDTVNITWADTQQGRSPAGTAIRTAKPAVNRDALTNADYTSWRSEALELGYASSVSLPLLAGEQKVLGALNVYATRPDAFSDEEIDLLMELARNLAYGILSLRARAEQRSAEIRSLDMLHFLQTLIDTIPVSIFYRDTEGIYRGCNTAYEAFLGLSREQIVGKSVYEIFPEDLAGKYFEMDSALFRHPGKQVYEWQISSADGSRRDVILNKASYFNTDGALGGLVAAMVDITERRRAEDALRESERKYRSFFESSFDAIFLTVPENDGAILAASPEACRMFGYTEEEFCKLGRSAIVDTTDPQWKQFLEERALRSRARGEMVHIRKDGTKFPTDVSSSIFEDKDGRNLCITIIRDISEHKRYEQALQKSEEHYRSLFENMLDGLAYCKVIFENEQPVDFEYLAVNSAFEELTGLKNVPGKKITQVIPDIKESNPELFEIYGRVALTGRPERFETYVPGLGIWFIISLYSLEKGSFVAIFDDISHRKKAEAALRFANEELEKRVEERTAELEARTVNLEEVNTALKVLLDRREEDRKDLEEAIAGNLKSLILPYIEKLQKTQLSPDQATYLSILQSHLHDIESRFIKKLSLQHMGLTPTEMQVAALIRDGKTSKDIADLLHVSEKAVEFHRNNIRRRLRIKNKKENLRSHLLGLS